MEKKTVNQQIISNDVLRYKKNKLASLLALLGLVFNCLYFMVLYAMPKEDFTTIRIGFSVILTLIVLLVIFLSSEGVKGYNKKFSIVLLVVAAFQILRIFGYPLEGLKNNTLIAADDTHTIGYFGIYPKNSGMFFGLMTVYLAASAACLIASAVIGWIYATRLQKFQKQLDLGEISVEAALAALNEDEAREEAAVAEVVAQAETKAEVNEVSAVEVAEIKTEQAETVAEEVKEVKPAEPVAEAKKPAAPRKTTAAKSSGTAKSTTAAKKPASTAKKPAQTNAKPKTTGTKTAKKPADTNREVK